MRFVWIAILIAAAPSFADVLVEKVPTGAAPERVLAVVQRAFIGRKWRIESVDSDSVTAELFHNTIKARMTVSLSNGQLFYETHSVKTRVVNPASRDFAGNVPTATPRPWIRNIQVDVETLLTVLPTN